MRLEGPEEEGGVVPTSTRQDTYTCSGTKGPMAHISNKSQ